MSFPDRNNPYTFNPYLEWRRSADYYRDDAFVQKMLKIYAGPEAGAVDAEARQFSQKASFRWRDLTERIATPDNRPYMMH